MHSYLQLYAWFIPITARRELESWQEVLDELIIRFSRLSVMTLHHLVTRHNQLQILKSTFIIDDAGSRGEMGAEGQYAQHPSRVGALLTSVMQYPQLSRSSVRSVPPADRNSYTSAQVCALLETLLAFTWLHDTQFMWYFRRVVLC